MEAEGVRFFDKPVTEVIKSRTSVRSYREESLGKDVKDRLRGFMKEVKGPFDARCRLELIDNSVAQKGEGVKLGTYGVIKGASSFFAAAIDKSARGPEQLGFVFEQLVLFSCSMGLGTCWLGGTFKKSEFAKIMDLREDELLPIVSPVGYAREKRGVVDSLFRLGAGSNNRKDWTELFFNGGFDTGLGREEAGEYSIPLEMVRLGPSASNKQPWRLVKDNDVFHFYVKRTKGYGDRLGFDIQRLDMGIAMCHFQLTAGEQGLKGEWAELEAELPKLPEDTSYIISWVCKN